MSVRAVSIDELTGGGPIVVFTPTIADACLACGAMLATCFARRGALLVTTLAATSPAWMTVPARSTHVASRRAGARPAAIDVADAGATADVTSRRPTRLADEDENDLLAPLMELGGATASVKALAPDDAAEGWDRARPDRTSRDIAELCRAFGVRSLFLPMTPRRPSRHAGVVEAAVLRVRATHEGVRTWRYPTGGHGAMQDWALGPERHVRIFDPRPAREPKRRALARMHAAGFELPPEAGARELADDRPARLAAEPERYLQDMEA